MWADDTHDTCWLIHGPREVSRGQVINIWSYIRSPVLIISTQMAPVLHLCKQQNGTPLSPATSLFIVRVSDGVSYISCDTHDREPCDLTPTLFMTHHTISVHNKAAAAAVQMPEVRLEYSGISLILQAQKQRCCSDRWRHTVMRARARRSCSPNIVSDPDECVIQQIMRLCAAVVGRLHGEMC